MKISTNPIQIPITPRLQFSKTNLTLYKQTLSNFETPNLARETLENIDLHIETWTNKIKQITHATTPTIQYRVLPGVKQKNYIRKTQRMHKKLMSIINMHGTNIQRHQLLQTLRQNISDEYNRLNNITWDNIIAKIDTNNDPKTFFNAIKRMTGNAPKISPYIIHNEIKLYDPRQQEPIFRDYWKNIFTSEDPNDNNFDYEFTENIENQLDERTERITPHNNSDINRLNINNCPPISHTEVTDVIQAMKHKAPGPNKLTANQLKNLPPNMTNFLTEIFNRSLSAGYFPNSYKHATMILIPKAGTSGTAVKDKRPISLLNVDGKLLDKILNKRLYTFLEENNLKNERQHGFRRNRGTQTAILTLHETISKHLSLKHKVDIACRDVTKAFNKIWHTGLKYKITGIMTSLML